MSPADPPKSAQPDADKPPRGAPPAHPGINLDHVNRLIAGLERELAKAGSDAPGVQDLKDEIETLKNVLRSPKIKPGWIREGLHSVRAGLESVQYEVLKDAPYVAEIGRILGM
jgi:hypothetical protein